MRAFETWIAYYNNHYLRSALGYKTPRQFELDYQHSHGTPFVAA
jgi:transposase InsO family protein